MSHRFVSFSLALATGLVLAILSFKWISDPEPARQRAMEERAVLASRVILRRYVQAEQELQIVDPLAPDRIIGKVFIYPANRGWEVSGHYRRGSTGHWHPYLMHLDESLALAKLSVRDDHVLIRQRAAADPKFHAKP